MKVSFLSIDDENNKINFSTEVTHVDNRYIFVDKTTENTIIEIEVLGECVRLTRTGNVTMYMLYDINNLTCGSYENKEGLEFEFEIQTTKLEIQKSKIRIDYSMIMDKQVMSSHKLSLLFN